MGLHLVLLGFCKLHGAGAPLLVTLAWPFFIKVLFSLRPFKNVIMSIKQDSRLFVFQLSQIIGFQDHRANHEPGNRRRWDRIIQLVHQRLRDIGHSMPFSDYERTLQTLTVAAF
ncbi:hypothetical protein L1987_71884 [Smallanthus sonchifolius]|uniref:Uncharacterized protein n=1 Tax=Smallanthus sonchifolius TaxID=185202 RepID=A0ACB9AST1_9ASTR|nr:hypothetical protein L1987_71884 [Smallanthus sonchifolius]